MGTANHILALDQGTTSSRAMVFDQFAAEVSVARQPTTQIYPRPGWVNQDPVEIWTTTLEAARAALEQAGLTGPDLAGIGIVNQRETLIVWEREANRAASPAIVWQSRQSQPQVDALLDRGMGPAYQSRTGLVPDAYFTASKLAWLLEDQPNLRRQAESGELLAGTVDS
jgi:glycerol kinase